jgi:hypothetical protein
MIRLRLLSLALATVLMSAGGPPALAAEIMKHSGTVLAFDTERGQVVLEEVGPWQVRNGVTQTIRRTIVLDQATKVTWAVRGNPPGRFSGDFNQVPLAPLGVEVGDAVTVVCRHDGDRLVALEIIIADAAQP